MTRKVLTPTDIAERQKAKNQKNFEYAASEMAPAAIGEVVLKILETKESATRSEIIEVFETMISARMAREENSVPDLIALRAGECIRRLRRETESGGPSAPVSKA